MVKLLPKGGNFSGSTTSKPFAGNQAVGQHQQTGILGNEQDYFNHGTPQSAAAPGSNTVSFGQPLHGQPIFPAQIFYGPNPTPPAGLSFGLQQPATAPSPQQFAASFPAPQQHLGSMTNTVTPQPSNQHFTRGGQPTTPSFGGHATAQQSTPQYTDLASVFQSMSVQQPPDNNYYMDTGATSHMSFNQGS